MKLTTSQRQVLKKLLSRSQSKIRWFNTSFPEQLAFLKDPAPLKAALCTRRAGKSYGIGELACKTAMENPGVSIGIIGLTRDSIKKIYFKDIIDVLNRKHGLNIHVNRTELSCQFPNKSVIYFAGADANEEEMNKFLGQKYKLVVIDEAGHYKNIDLKKLVEDILEPAVTDLRGQIILIGTPSNFIDSYFYHVTEKHVPGWSVHRWNCLQNPHVAAQVAEFLTRAKARNPNIENDPGYKQHWLGQWEVDLGARIYKFDPEINTMGNVNFAGYQFILGIDLGYEDASAFVVGAWSHYDQTLHIVHAESESHLDLSQVETRIRRLQSLYNIGTIVIDGASKQGVEELQKRFSLGFQRADKQGKKDFIEIMNNDFLMKRIDVSAQGCKPLIKEWSALIWDSKAREKGKWEEARSCANHCADAALYMWRYSYSYSAIPKSAPLSMEQEIENMLILKDTVKDEERDAYDNSDYL